IKAAQTLARHFDPKLTIGRYTHADRAEPGKAVDRLDLPGNEPRPDSSPHLGLALILMQTVLGHLLVAPRVAPTSETPGDASERVESDGSGAAAAEDAA